MRHDVQRSKEEDQEIGPSQKPKTRVLVKGSRQQFSYHRGHVRWKVLSFSTSVISGIVETDGRLQWGVRVKRGNGSVRYTLKKTRRKRNVRDSVANMR